MKTEHDEEATARPKHPLALKRSSKSPAFMRGWNAALQYSLGARRVPDLAPEFLDKGYRDGWDSLVLLLATLEKAA